MKAMCIWMGCWVLATGGLCAQSVVTLTATSAGDGYHHDELGTAYDYFDATSPTNLVNYQFWGSSSDVSTNISYLQFSLAALPDDFELSSAILNLYITEIHYGDESPNGGFIKLVTTPTSANGLASQRLNGTEILATLKDQGAGWLSVDVTDAMLNHQSLGYAYMAFSMQANTTGYFRYSGFSFTSADAGSNQPYLSVTSAVPEPAHAALAGGGLVALGVLWWRRRGRCAH